MGISIKTHKMLWGRSGNKCAICKTDLAEDFTETDDFSILGQEAHIVARETNGARGISELSEIDRDKYANLILLCQKDHKIIDDHEELYTVEKLKELKQSHLDWVKLNLSLDNIKQRDDETYATYLETFIELGQIENWNIWTSNLLSSGQPQISKEQYDNLNKLNEYLLARIWPKRYEAIEFGFINFRNILNDFYKVISEHLDKKDVDYYSTEKFYRNYRGETSMDYDDGIRKYEYHVSLIQDLVLEMTRSLNYLVIQIRNFISASFRTQEGLFLITTGPDINLAWTTVRLEYHTNIKEEIKYKGLKDFMTSREKNSYHFGEGFSKDYFIDEEFTKMMGR